MIILKANLGMLFGQFHVIKNPKKNLEQIFPPMGFERSTMGLDNVEEYSKRTRSHVQFAPTHHAGQLKQQWEPSSYLKENAEKDE